jgi:hypothetical protein
MTRDNGLSYRDIGAAEIIPTHPRSTPQTTQLRQRAPPAGGPVGPINIVRLTYASTPSWFALQANAIGIYNPPPCSG